MATPAPNPIDTASSHGYSLSSADRSPAAAAEITVQHHAGFAGTAHLVTASTSEVVHGGTEVVQCGDVVFVQPDAVVAGRLPDRGFRTYRFAFAASAPAAAGSGADIAGAASWKALEEVAFALRDRQVQASRTEWVSRTAARKGSATAPPPPWG